MRDNLNMKLQNRWNGDKFERVKTAYISLHLVCKCSLRVIKLLERVFCFLRWATGISVTLLSIPNAKQCYLSHISTSRYDIKKSAALSNAAGQAWWCFKVCCIVGFFYIIWHLRNLQHTYADSNRTNRSYALTMWLILHNLLHVDA